MNISTRCPGCRTTVEVPYELLGRLVRCPIPECGLTFTAEAKHALAPPVEAERPSPLSQYSVPALPRRGVGLNPIWVVLAVVSLIVIAACGAAIWTMLDAAEPKIGPTPVTTTVPSAPPEAPEE